MQIKSPNNIADKKHLFKVFLAGSIEMGTAANWQQTIADFFEQYEDMVLLNPRRDDWDATWEQSISNPQFNAQVNWELDHLAMADLIVVYFDPATKSPVTMLELGLHAASGKLVVCCPQGFWRKGNIDIVCKKYNIDMAENIEQLIGMIKQQLFLFISE